MSEIISILIMGFLTGITTILFGFGGGFVVVPFVYHLGSSLGTVDSNAMHVAVATSAAIMIANAGYATYINWRRGVILSETITPLLYYISFGAIFGAIAASVMKESMLKNLFLVYMLITIVDCIFRDGFLNKTAFKKISKTMFSIFGLFIGGIAVMLGVGGSVMTVPLLRRHGYEMKYCVSAANPLSIPVAIIGSLVYVMAGINHDLGVEYIGYVNIKILFLFLVSGVIGITFAKKVIPELDDKLHAKIYLLLLILVLVAMSAD